MQQNDYSSLIAASHSLHDHNNMMMQLVLLSLFASLSGTSAKVLSLTGSNFAEKTAGKTVFLKMFAPWCGHCQAMAADWEKLADEWEGHEFGLVAEVDCDSEDELCDQFNVQGFPTLLYGDPNELEAYEGSRSLDALQEFAKENIAKPFCSVSNTEHCDDATKKLISELEKKDSTELHKVLDEADEKASEAEALFDQELEKLQKEYEVMETAYKEKVEKIKSEANYKLVRAIVAKRGDLVPDDLGDEDDAEGSDEL